MQYGQHYHSYRARNILNGLRSNASLQAIADALQQAADSQRDVWARADAEWKDHESPGTLAEKESMVDAAWVVYDILRTIADHVQRHVD